MTIRAKFIGGNWKMNGLLSDAHRRIETMLNCSMSSLEMDVVVFPPYVHLPYVSELLKQQSSIQLGAQNLSAFEKGAYTGEVSGDMLRDVQCQYVLIGHSERRHILGESNEIIAQKIQQALNVKLTPVLCIGETSEEYESGQTENILIQQLNSAIQSYDVTELAHMVIAYEPVWAIGTGTPATPDRVQTVHHMIRKHVAQSNSSIASKMRIIYGGSVTPDNAKELITLDDVDGALVGGASLDAEKFVQIILESAAASVFRA